MPGPAPERPREDDPAAPTQEQRMSAGDIDRCYPSWGASGGALEDAAAFAAYHLASLAAFLHTADLRAKRGIT